MMGMNKYTGTSLDGAAHRRQRIANILSTPIGSRPKRRDYGSRLFALTDKPMTPALMIDVIHASAEAIAKWETAFQLSKIYVDMKKPGQTIIDLEGKDLVSGKMIALEGIQL